MKSCTDFLRREVNQAIESNRRDTTFVTNNISDVMKKEIQNIQD
jgi:hypothetical protein